MAAKPQLKGPLHPLRSLKAGGLCYSQAEPSKVQGLVSVSNKPMDSGVGRATQPRDIALWTLDVGPWTFD